MTRVPRALWSAANARFRRVESAHRPSDRHGDQQEDRDGEDVAEVDGASIRMSAASAPSSITGRGTRLARQVDGILDWYLLGVVVGLGVTAGAAASGARGRLAYVILARRLPPAPSSWTCSRFPCGRCFPFAAAALAAWLALRRLSADALPAALLACVVLTALPALGYVAAVAVPVAGARLGRKAGSRYAGLRVLAKD